MRTSVVLLVFLTLLVPAVRGAGLRTRFRLNPVRCFADPDPNPRPARSPWWSVSRLFQNSPSDLFTRCTSLRRSRSKHGRRPSDDAPPPIASQASDRMSDDEDVPATALPEMFGVEVFDLPDDDTGPGPADSDNDVDVCSIGSHVSAVGQSLPLEQIVAEVLRPTASQHDTIAVVVDDLLHDCIIDVVIDLNQTALLRDFISDGRDCPPIAFRSDWHEVFDAVVLLAQDPTSDLDAIAPLYGRYGQLSPDLQSALDNLATLHEMRVVYDLVRLLDERLAAMTRAFRYTLTYSGWQLIHGLCEALAIRKICDIVTRNGDPIAADAESCAAFERVLQETGLDRNVQFTTLLYDRVKKEWDCRHIAVNEVIISAIADVDVLYGSQLQPSTSTFQSTTTFDFNLVDSACHQEIRNIYDQNMEMLLDRYVPDTMFGSIYAAPCTKSQYSTDELRSLLQTIEDERNNDALDQLNLAIESGLYVEFERLPNQSALRRFFLLELVKVQRRRTVARALPTCFDLISALFGGAPRGPDQRHLLIVYLRTQSIVGNTINEMLSGASPIPLQVELDLDVAWTLPVLRFVSDQNSWVPDLIPLQPVVEIALDRARLSVEHVPDAISRDNIDLDPTKASSSFLSDFGKAPLLDHRLQSI